MQQNESSTDQEEVEQKEREAAYRRGFVHGMEEATQLVVQLQGLGYRTATIKKLLAVYDDHVVAPWRQGDLSKREAMPPFDLNHCQKILENTTGYDWIV